MAPLKFDWDKGNQTKSVTKHKVENDEAESVFNDPGRIVVLSQRMVEIRFICVGMSDKNRLLTAYFIVRNGKVRIIGTRVASKKEQEKYDEAQ